MRFPAFIIAFLILIPAQGWGARLAPVTVLGGKGAADTGSAAVSRELTDYIRAQKLKVVDSSRSPVLAQTAEKLREMAQKLVEVEDGPGPIRLILVDDMTVNASFKKLTSGERVMTVNLGLLDFAKNDDSVAFVLGHELEHGRSQIQKKVDKMKARALKLIEAGRSEGASLYDEARVLERAVENEVDGKSMFRRLHRAGYNPHAAIHMTDEMEAAFGDKLSLTHTRMSSRNDTLGLALTHMKRDLGIAVKPDEAHAYSTQITGTIQRSYLQTDAFRKSRWQQANAVISRSDPAVRDYYEQVKNEKFLKPALMGRPGYHTIFDSKEAELKSILGNIPTREEWIAVQIRLHRALHTQFASARDLILGQDFKPRSYAQLEQFLDLEDWRYDTSIPDYFETLDEQTELKSKLSKAKEALAASGTNTEKGKEATSEIVTLENKLAKTQEDLDIALRHYDPEELKKGSSAIIFPKDDSKLAIAQKVRWKRAFLENLDLFLDQSTSFRELTRYLAYNPRLSQSDVDSYLHKVFGNKHIRDLQVASVYPTAKKTPGMYEPDLGSLWGNNGPNDFRELFSRYLARDRDHAVKDLQALLDELLRKAKTPDDVGRVFAMIKPDYISNTEIGMKPTFGTRRWGPGGYDAYDPAHLGGFYFSDQLAEEVFTEPFLSTYLKEAQRVSMSALRRSKSIHEAINSLNTYQDRIDRLRLAGVLKAKSASELRLDLVQDMAKRISKLVPVSAMEKLSQKDLVNIILAGHSGFYEAMDPAYRPTFIQISESLEKVSSDPVLRDLFHGEVNLYELHNVFDAAKYGDKQTLFRLISKMEALIDFDARTMPARRTPGLGEAVLRETVECESWIKSNLPERFQLRAKVLSLLSFEKVHANDALLTRFQQQSRDLFSDTFTFHLKNAKSLSYREQVAEGAYRTWRDLWQTLGDSTEPAIALEEAFIKVAPHEPAKKYEFFLGLFDGAQRYSSEMGFGTLANGGIAKYSELESRILPRVPINWFKHQIQTEVASPDVMLEAFQKLIAFEREPSPQTDLLFQKLWRMAEHNSAIRTAFLDPTVVRKIYYDENKKALAIWQLDQKFALEKTYHELKADRLPIPHGNEVRPVVREARDVLEIQIPGQSGLKDEVVEHVSSRLMTSASETDLLDKNKVGPNNWFKSRAIEAVDLPQSLARAAPSNYERLAIIKYLVGATDQLPSFIETKFGLDGYVNLGFGYRMSREDFETFRRHFAGADRRVRIYALQPLLDARNGILGEAAVEHDLIDFVLGSHAKDSLFPKLFRTYLSVITEPEKKAILGHILSSFVSGAGKQVSLSTVLEAIPPLGAKVAQVLRTSGAAGQSLRLDLDKFFDSAAPPSRSQIMEQMRTVFGADLREVRGIRQLVGSGSVNYIVLADVKNPGTGKVQRVTIRLQREGVEGQATHEYQNWKKVTQILRSDPDVEVQRAVRIIDDVLEQSYATLKPGGLELRQSYEREAFQRAERAYADFADRSSGFRVRAVRPVEAIQALVPPELADKVSVYEYVPNIRLTEIADPRIQKKLAKRIVTRELEALFRSGEFDADGHPGNWLENLDAREVVRIDYAQIDRISPEGLRDFRRTTSALMMPHVDRGLASKVSEILPSLFTSNVPLRNLEDKVYAIMKSPGFPKYTEPHERLFYLREELEKVLRAGGYPNAILELSPEPRRALTSLSRIMVYREYMGDQEFGKLLLQYADARKDYLISTAKGKIANAVTGASEKVHCIRNALFMLLKKIPTQR